METEETNIQRQHRIINLQAKVNKKEQEEFGNTILKIIQFVKARKLDRIV
jgi:hypothetical protein